MEESEMDDGVTIQSDGEDDFVPESKSTNPAFLSVLFSSGVEYLQQYGWFILLGVLILWYIKTKLDPKIKKLKSKAEDISYQKNMVNPDTTQRRLEAMERARMKLQEEHDAKAAMYAEQQKQKEEERRKQKIEEWENLQDGKGYRSKVKPKDESSENPGKLKPKPKLRQNDYNPLMGGGGPGYRPARRTGGG